MIVRRQVQPFHPKRSENDRRKATVHFTANKHLKSCERHKRSLLPRWQSRHVATAVTRPSPKTAAYTKTQRRPAATKREVSRADLSRTAVSRARHLPPRVDTRRAPGIAQRRSAPHATRAEPTNCPDPSPHKAKNRLWRAFAWCASPCSTRVRFPASAVFALVPAAGRDQNGPTLPLGDTPEQEGTAMTDLHPDTPRQEPATPRGRSVLAPRLRPRRCRLRGRQAGGVSGLKLDAGFAVFLLEYDRASWCRSARTASSRLIPEITSQWGGPQTILGVRSWCVPYRYVQRRRPATLRRAQPRMGTSQLYFLPKHLDIATDVKA